MHEPERYEENKSAAAKANDEFVPYLLKRMSDWKDSETILDYGCGAGTVVNKHFLPLAVKRNSQIYAVDISSEMLKHAELNFPHPLIKYVHGDIQANDFPLLGMRFDRIFSIIVLHFIRDYRRALRTFHQILKPDGEIGFTVATKANFFRPLQILGEDPKWSKYMQGYEEFIPEWFEKDENAEDCFRTSMLDIGYTDIDIKTHSGTYTYKFDSMIEFYISLNPFSTRIPQELQQELRIDYRRHISEMMAIRPDSEFVQVNYEMITGIAKRGDVGGFRSFDNCAAEIGGQDLKNLWKH